ncbi:hypothetical protein HDU93_008987 [Gonapodya sp. JEL0774]|nr:hypothetical protein HDU93_008987 [Gonapodya sp. JEL0774]
MAAAATFSVMTFPTYSTGESHASDTSTAARGRGDGKSKGEADEYLVTIQRLREQTKDVMERLRKNVSEVKRSVKGPEVVKSVLKGPAETKETKERHLGTAGRASKRGVTFALGADGCHDLDVELQRARIPQPQTRQQQSQAGPPLFLAPPTKRVALPFSSEPSLPAPPPPPGPLPRSPTGQMAPDPTPQSPSPDRQEASLALQSPPLKQQPISSHQSTHHPSYPPHLHPTPSPHLRTPPPHYGQHHSHTSLSQPVLESIMSSPLLTLPDAYLASLRDFRAANRHLVEGDPVAKLELDSEVVKGWQEERQARGEEKENGWYPASIVYPPPHAMPLSGWSSLKAEIGAATGIEKIAADMVRESKLEQNMQAVPVRVTVPHNHVLPQPVRYKPHRRVSFDPGDGVGLGAHLHASYAYPNRATGAPKRAQRVSLAAETTTDVAGMGELGKEWVGQW